jgi:hypothetical protein
MIVKKVKPNLTLNKNTANNFMLLVAAAVLISGLIVSGILVQTPNRLTSQAAGPTAQELP